MHSKTQMQNFILLSVQNCKLLLNQTDSGSSESGLMLLSTIVSSFKDFQFNVKFKL